MNSMLKKAGLGVALAATAVTTAAPAEAQRYNGRYRHHDNGGTAIVAGIAGLAIGAAIASGNRRDRYYDRGYDNRYYNDGYNRRGYYPPQNYYRDDYRNRRGVRCFTERRWDPYYRERVRVRVCR